MTTPLLTPLGLSALRGPALLWPLLLGAGLYLLVTAQPLGRPRPDLAERLRRLDVDERTRLDHARHESRPFFRSRLLEALLRPLLDDLGDLARRGAGRLGLADGRDVELHLRLVRPGVEVSQFWGEKLAGTLIGGALFPLMNGLGIHPFGPWPGWVWVAGAAGGFLLPDGDLARRVGRRRARLVMELPAVIDLLTIAVSAGQALEPALELVARRSGGEIGRELRGVLREIVLARRPLGAALADMAARNGVPELTSLVTHLCAAEQRGLPLVQTLTGEAATLRERKRLRIVAEGGKAMVRMVIPVALFILPVLFVVLLFPAAVQLLSLSG